MKTFSIYFGAVFLFVGFGAEANATLVLLFFGYVGILTHYVKKWSDLVAKDEVLNIKKCVPSIVLSIITTSILVIVREEIVNLFVFTKFSSFIVGYFGNSWFFGFIEKKMYNLNSNTNYDNEISN